MTNPFLFYSFSFPISRRLHRKPRIIPMKLYRMTNPFPFYSFFSLHRLLHHQIKRKPQIIRQHWNRLQFAIEPFSLLFYSLSFPISLRSFYHQIDRKPRITRQHRFAIHTIPTISLSPESSPKSNESTRSAAAHDTWYPSKAYFPEHAMLQRCSVGTVIVPSNLVPRPVIYGVRERKRKYGRLICIELGHDEAEIERSRFRLFHSRGKSSTTL